MVFNSLGVPNHMVWATNSGYSKLHSRARSTECTKPHALTQPINSNIIAQKGTMIPFTAQTHHPLNNQLLAIFFPAGTIPASLHY